MEKASRRPLGLSGFCRVESFGGARSRFLLPGGQQTLDGLADLVPLLAERLHHHGIDQELDVRLAGEVTPSWERLDGSNPRSKRVPKILGSTALQSSPEVSAGCTPIL